MTLPFPCPVFVINLARDTDRRAHAEKTLAALGIDAQFVTAVDGRALTATDRAMVDPAKTARLYGHAMMDSEIACYLSHYRIYEKMLREDIPVALVMEDDLAIDPTLPRIVRDILDVPFQKWQVVRLQSARKKIVAGATPDFAGRAVADLTDGKVYALRVHVLGACAYLIRQAGARAMVEYGQRIFMPIDHTMDRYWENGILPYVVRPFPVRQHDDFGTSIGDRSAKQSRPWPTRVQRWRDSIKKRLFWAISI